MVSIISYYMYYLYSFWHLYIIANSGIKRYLFLHLYCIDFVNSYTNTLVDINEAEYHQAEWLKLDVNNILLCNETTIQFCQ